MKKKLYKQISHKDFDILRQPGVIRYFAKQVFRRINPDTDIIFSPGSIPIACLETDIPKVFYTDATFAGMIGFYKNYSNLCSETIKYGHYIEQKALETSTLAIYSSEWAARTAIDNYNVDPDKIKVVPFGANIEHSRDNRGIQDIIRSRSKDECNLLFMGVDWDRKGGDLALSIAKKLNESGLKTNLLVAGIDKIPDYALQDFVQNHGFLSKSDPKGRKNINELFSKSHFLLVPSIAEAYGLVFCEANAFGLPSLSTDVGGITTVIRNGINGKAFSVNSDIQEWVSFIIETFNNESKYTAMCLSSFKEYQNRLNWDVAGKTIIKLMEKLL